MKQIIVILSFLCILTTITDTYALEKLTLILDWLPYPAHAPLFVAEEKGFFKAEGLDVQLIGPADPTDPPKLVAAGKADIAITYEPQFIEQIDKGLPLIRIATLVDKPLDCLVVLKESSIQSLTDLKGKKIGTSTGGISQLALKTMLEKKGILLNDVELINVHYDLTQALLSKKIDAATGMMRTLEPIQLEILGHPGVSFYPEDYGVPTYSELILVANKNHIKDIKFKKFLIALKKGCDYLQKNPNETWLLFAKSHHELNNELNKRSWFLSLKYFAKNPYEFDRQQWLNFIDFMQHHGLIQQAQPIDRYAINLGTN